MEEGDGLEKVWWEEEVVEGAPFEAGRDEDDPL